MSSALLITAALAAYAPNPSSLPLHRPTASRAAVRLFDEPAKPADFSLASSVTRSREVGLGRTGSIVVTDASGSFQQSRGVFNTLYDFGGYASITASSTSTAEAKKMLISRKTRYSGLIDVLSFEEAATPSFEGADSWLALNVDQATIGAQIDAAAAAGVKRAFFLCSTLITSWEPLEEKLKAAGMTFTMMRIGELAEAAEAGAGLKLGALDLPVCEAVAKDDVFRFVTEALSLDEASDKAFSLCPSEGTAPALKQMRLCGYERRDEVKAILSGVVPDDDATAAAADLSPAEQEEQAELVMRSEAEVAAEREEELKALLERARKRGEELAEKRRFEEEEKLVWRKEQERYYSTQDRKDKNGGDAGDDDDTPTIPDAPPPLE